MIDGTHGLHGNGESEDTTGTEIPTSPVVRTLSEKEKNILSRRYSVVQKLAAELRAAAAVYQECLILLTGGDESLAVDVQQGVILRKQGGDKH